MKRKAEGVTGIVYTCRCGNEYYRDIDMTDALFLEGRAIVADVAMCDKCLLELKRAEWKEKA